MEKKINWGIIGIGKIAEKFASDLATVENAELLAVASSSIDRATDFAGRHGAQFAYGSYEQLFEAEGLDAVYIATPHNLHHECTMLCLKHKKAVLCEKPFAMNEEEVDEMIETAQKSETFLMEALWTRFLPSTKKVLELIDAGAIGKVKTLQADFGFIPPYMPERRTLNRALGGGAFLDIGIYPAFLSLLILGYPSKILAAATMGPTGVDETTTFVYQYDDLATASLNCSFGTNTETDAIIYGDKGRIHIKRKFHESKEVSFIPDEGEAQTFEFPRETFGYDYEIREVNDCLRRGATQSELWSHKDSKRLIHLLDVTREKAGISYETDRSF
ncbi:Gfo/Idh/MocA family protein [Jiulongibacter sp. NS-SX5]|uniref:Gfo/Idh/MocA family protein n=1 Tax=Jiulongibacter sp. NS-SX5 TaxID=3463854 RepID=UPI004059BDFE